MKSKLVFILPSVALIGFLAIKPPALGGQSGQVIVTPDATITPAAQPNLRDFDDEGHGPDHEDYDDNDYKPKQNLNSGDPAPITETTPGVIPMPNLGGGGDDDDDDDEYEGNEHRKGHHDDHEDNDYESDEHDDD